MNKKSFLLLFLAVCMITVLSFTSTAFATTEDVMLMSKFVELPTGQFEEQTHFSGYTPTYIAMRVVYDTQSYFEQIIFDGNIQTVSSYNFVDCLRYRSLNSGTAIDLQQKQYILLTDPLPSVSYYMRCQVDFIINVGGTAHVFTFNNCPIHYVASENFTSGYNSGYDRGYNVGYTEGYSDGEEVTLHDQLPFGALVDAGNSFFAIEPFGNGVTIGMLLGIPFGLILIGLAIKMFLGG